MSDDVDKKDLIMKGLVWSIPVIFGAGAFMQMVSSDAASIGDLQEKVEAQEQALSAHSSLSGHAVSQTQIQHLTDQQDEMLVDQRAMREEQRDMALDLAAICHATGANCGSR
jgi:hypothetical protein